MAILFNENVHFFLIAPPGLEDLTLRELRIWQPDVRAQITRGGIEVELPLAQGLQLNRYLKTPTRLLLRLTDFGCRDFPKLFRKLSGLAWDDLLGAAETVEFHASTHGSRLKMKKRIEQTCADAWKAYRKKKPVPVGREERARESVAIYVRFVDDVCTVSLDTSGELLHKRGVKTLSAEAPLRETLAASLLLLLEASGDAPAARSVELVDPMMGSGTFLFEAERQLEPVVSRRFAFEQLKPLAGLMAEPEPLRVAKPPTFGSLIGFEANEKTWRAAKANLADATATLYHEDFFAAEPLAPPAAGHERWLIANPPYGERLKVQGNLIDFYSRLFRQAEVVARPDRALFLLPAKISSGRLLLPSTWSKAGERRFLNGGLPVVAHVFCRRADARWRATGIDNPKGIK